METKHRSENQEEVKRNKTYLYHLVPADMQGTILHPLNRLKETHPDLYVAKAKKYDQRKGLMDRIIPTLACKWNDVLHLSPIHPAELKQALIEAGMPPREMKFYEIDPEKLDPSKTTIFLYREAFEDDHMHPDNFSAYRPDQLAEHSSLPQATKAYYREMFHKGEKPFTFVGVPHIFHKGPIDISDLPVIVV